MDGIDPDCVVAVRYDGYEGYYSFYNADYSFLSLGDLIDKLDLENHLVINNSFQHTVWLDEDRENNWFRWDFYHLPDVSVVWDMLLSERDVPDSSDASNEELGWEIMSISIDYSTCRAVQYRHRAFRQWLSGNQYPGYIQGIQDRHRPH